MGGLAVEVATGRAEAVLYHEGADAEIFGGTPGSIHPDLGTFARTGNY